VVSWEFGVRSSEGTGIGNRESGIASFGRLILAIFVPSDSRIKRLKVGGGEW